jgi:Protein of unknown function (DUF3037)
MFRYQILRYLPNVIRGEYVNIGVVLEEMDNSRVAIRLVEESREWARIRRFHPEVDEVLLRNFANDFESRLRTNTPDFDNFNQSLSNALQFSPAQPTLADNFNEELDRLYNEYVALPHRVSAQIVEHTRDWMRDKLKDVFRRHQILNRLTKDVPVESFTHPGDPFRLDYGYQNGVRGFVHVVSLGGDIPEAKVLAYTAEKIHEQSVRAKITAITEVAPLPDVPRQRFVEVLFAEQNIEIVPMDQVDAFVGELSKRLA